ncbi:MAG TPA: sugar phosphate isomerase/epimerase family protein [Terriglobia bacterium]|nr:sugar phosphate isomerase/epimerase family protein [Terriglobia bacterium]
MDFGLSTHLFVSERLSSHILDGILAAGFRTIEIFAARQHLDYYDLNHVRDVAQWFKDHEMTLHSLHAPLYADFDWGRSDGQALSVAHLERRRRIDSMEEIKRAIEVAERIPFRYLILHLGLVEEEYDLQKFDAAMTSIEHLKIFAKERGAQILLENTPNELSTPERLVKFIEYSRLEDLKICFDTGHAHMTCGVRPAFETLKGRIASTHVHDNRREKDDHAFPYDGGIDWEQTMRDFRSVEGQFPVIFELRDYGPETSGLGRLREVIQKMDSIR